MRGTGNEKVYRGSAQNIETVSRENDSILIQAFVMKLESLKTVTRGKVLKKIFYHLGAFLLKC